VIDARLLVEAAAAATRSDIITDPHRELTADQAATLDSFLSRREHREPVSHILGRKGFWKIMLRVTPDVLTPRPDTETVVEYVLRDFPEHAAWSVLDLGVGSGAILLAILAERPAAKGLGVDISEEALAVARDNAASLGLAGRMALMRADWSSLLEADEFRPGGLQPALHRRRRDRDAGPGGARPRTAAGAGGRSRRAGPLTAPWRRRSCGC
jgi:release factor glutamine methyltransferase